MEDEDAMSDNSVPFGYGASAFGSEGEEEEDDVAIHREMALRHVELEAVTERYIITTGVKPVLLTSSGLVQGQLLSRSLQVTS